MHLHRPGAVDDAIATLNERLTACGNVHAQFSGPSASTAQVRAKRFYGRWVEETYDQLCNHFSDGLAEGLFSQRYWQIVQLADQHPMVLDLVRREIQVQSERLRDAIGRLKTFKRFVAREGSILVPDTSAFIQGVYFTDFDWNVGLGISGRVRLVVPILVVEELDKIKSFDKGKKQDRARKVLKKLREVLRAVPPGEPAQLRSDVTIEILIDDEWHERKHNNDGEIIGQALSVQGMTEREVMLVCVDAAMEFRAREHGLKVVAMPEQGDAA